jgi:hypothetical protein
LRLEQGAEGGAPVADRNAGPVDGTDEVFQELLEVFLENPGARLQTIARSGLPARLEAAHGTILEPPEGSDHERGRGEDPKGRTGGPRDAPGEEGRQAESGRGTGGQGQADLRRQKKKPVRQVEAQEEKDEAFEKEQEGGGHRLTSARKLMRRGLPISEGETVC